MMANHSFLKWRRERFAVSSNTFSSIIEKYFSRNGGWNRIKGELTVYYWPKIAGEELARKVEAIRFRDGYLYLQTENPALAHQILLMNVDILKKYQRLFGVRTIKGIKINIGAVKQKSPILSPPNTDIILNQEEATHIANCKSKITDPDLADKFANTMAINYKKQRQIKINGGKECLSCGIQIDDKFNYCPCCEQKVQQEIAAFIAYRKKHNLTVNMDELSKINDLKHLWGGRS